MSVEQSAVTSQHFAYIAEHTAGEDPFLAQLREDAASAGIPSISIGPVQAAFMQVVLRAARVREVVEVGTLAGYSAIVMARALPDGGRVRTIEVNGEHARFAAERAAASDVSGMVEVLHGSGDEVLATFEDESADAAFLDADKGGYQAYLEQCLRIVRPGGLIMADNAFAFGQLFDVEPTDREVPAVRSFNDALAADPRVEGIIVPFGDGMWLGTVA